MKNFLVIGGNSGIGLAIVKQLKTLEFNVITASRNKAEIEDIKHITLDVNEDISHLVDDLPEELHGVVYCPGTINLKPFGRFSEDDFLNDYKINVLGAVKVIQTVFKNLKAAQGASILLFSTVAVQNGMGFHASIAAAKGALEGITRTLASEFAQYKIRVNALAPSLTDTPLAANLLSTPEKREASDKRHPLGRVGTPEEMAYAATFLLSDHSSWITGQIIGIDGGMAAIRF